MNSLKQFMRSLFKVAINDTRIGQAIVYIQQRYSICKLMPQQHSNIPVKRYLSPYSATFRKCQIIFIKRNIHIL